MEYLRVFVAAAGSIIAEYLGVFDGMLHALVVFVIVDYISGILRAATEQKLSSNIGAKGIAKKVAIFVLVGVANVIDVHVIGTEHLTRSAVIAFYLTNEGISIIENMAGIGLPIPTKLVEILAQIDGKNRQSGESRGPK